MMFGRKIMKFVATSQPAGPAPEAPAPQAPVVEESSDEVLEPAPSGGVYWEE